MGAASAVLNILGFAGVVTYLWRYFGFVGFDLTKFKPVSAVSRIWSLVLAVGFPLLGLMSSFEDKTRKTLVGIGIATILVPAIVPDLEAPESDSLMERIYFRTVGKWVVNFFESAVVSLLLLVCWVFWRTNGPRSVLRFGWRFGKPRRLVNTRSPRNLSTSGSASCSSAPAS